MSVSADHGGKSRNNGVEIECLNIVNDIEGQCCDLDHFGFIELLCPWLDINVAADGRDRSNLFQSTNDVRRSNVSGVKNVLYTAECIERLGAQQTVSVGDHANQHLETSLNPRTWVHIIAQSIADEIKRQHRQHHSQRWEDHEMRRIKQV